MLAGTSAPINGSNNRAIVACDRPLPIIAPPRPHRLFRPLPTTQAPHRKSRHTATCRAPASCTHQQPRPRALRLAPVPDHRRSPRGARRGPAFWLRRLMEGRVPAAARARAADAARLRPRPPAQPLPRCQPRPQRRRPHRLRQRRQPRRAPQPRRRRPLRPRRLALSRSPRQGVPPRGAHHAPNPRPNHRAARAPQGT